MRFIMILTALFAVTPRAEAAPYERPLIITACHVQPHVTWPASGYDCFKAVALKHGRVLLDTDLSHSEATLLTNRAYHQLARKVEKKCGAGCRPFFGVIGNQCLALAQSRRFAGYGSFGGRETTKEDAEATALRDCERAVGGRGTCEIVTSACPADSPASESASFFPDEDDPVPSAGRWAAVSFSRTTQRVGRAFAERSELMAKETALRACREPDCELKAAVERGCVAAAKGYEQKTGWTWWAFGYAKFFEGEGSVKSRKLDVRIAAGEAAKASCDSAAHQLDCNVLESFCTWDRDEEKTSEVRITEWIEEMGGPESIGLKNTLQLVNVVNQSYLLNLGLGFDQASCLSARRWPSVKRFAVACSLGTTELDWLYSAAN